ncbi:hypothetical protein V6Z11_A12G033300 [Gossypium hirsutum]
MSSSSSSSFSSSPFSLLPPEMPMKLFLGDYGHPFFAHHHKFIPFFEIGISKLFNEVQAQISTKKEAYFNTLSNTIFHFFLVKYDYKKLYDVFYEFRSTMLNEVENKFGIERDKVCHNMIFLWVALVGQKLHKRLADEIRVVVKAKGGVTLFALNNMFLTKLLVYEYLRINPPVPFQYSEVKVDFVVQSHDATFEIMKGKMLFGFNHLQIKIPRFVREDREKLLKYVYWSNERETEDSTTENKACARKDSVVLLCRVLMVELFLHFETFEVEAGTFMFAPSVMFKTLTKTSSIT